MNSVADSPVLSRPTAQTPQSPYLTIEEAANYARVSPITIRRHYLAGNLEGRRFGAQIFTTAAWIDQWGRQ